VANAAIGERAADGLCGAEDRLEIQTGSFPGDGRTVRKRRSGDGSSPVASLPRFFSVPRVKRESRPRRRRNGGGVFALPSRS
jgi:hypothetical protein